MFHLTYAIQPAEALEFYQIAAKRMQPPELGRGSTLVRNAGYLFVGLAIGVALCVLLHFQYRFALGLIAGALIGASAVSFAIERNARKLFLDFHRYGPTQLNVTAGGVEEVYDEQRILGGWSAISSISQGHSIVVIWLKSDNGIIVPLRAFADDDAKSQFISTMNEKIALAALPRDHSIQ